MPQRDGIRGRRRKLCPACQVVKAIGEFGPDGKRGYCDECRRKHRHKDAMPKSTCACKFCSSPALPFFTLCAFCSSRALWLERHGRPLETVKAGADYPYEVAGDEADEAEDGAGDDAEPV